MEKSFQTRNALISFDLPNVRGCLTFAQNHSLRSKSKHNFTSSSTYQRSDGETAGSKRLTTRWRRRGGDDETQRRGKEGEAGAMQVRGRGKEGEAGAMQVKQSKKSSNKWVCVVCNQKQSVRNVFAESLVAKNIRHFVQKFNMSRQLSDRKESFIEEGEDVCEKDRFSEMEDKKKKRNDWTDYVEYDQDECSGRLEKYERPKGADSGNDTFDETMVVTEMPKPVLKKPKLKDIAAGIGHGNNLLKPVFPNRSRARRPKNARYEDMQQTQIICSDEEEQIELHRENLSSKQNSFMIQILDVNDNLAKKTDVSTSKLSKYITLSEYENTSNGQLNHKIAANGPVSKWSSYITKEDDTGFLD